MSETSDQKAFERELSKQAEGELRAEIDKARVIGCTWCKVRYEPVGAPRLCICMFSCCANHQGMLKSTWGAFDQVVDVDPSDRVTSMVPHVRVYGASVWKLYVLPKHALAGRLALGPLGLTGVLAAHFVRMNGLDLLKMSADGHEELQYIIDRDRLINDPNARKPGTQAFAARVVENRRIARSMGLVVQEASASNLQGLTPDPIPGNGWYESRSGRMTSSGGSLQVMPRQYAMPGVPDAEKHDPMYLYGDRIEGEEPPDDAIVVDEGDGGISKSNSAEDEYDSGPSTIFDDPPPSSQQ